MQDSDSVDVSDGCGWHRGAAKSAPKVAAIAHKKPRCGFYPPFSIAAGSKDDVESITIHY